MLRFGLTWRIFMVVVGMGRRVFLSYTSELREYPTQSMSFVRAAEAAVQRADCVPVHMSLFTSRDDPPAATCRQSLEGCDVYVGLIGLRYGSLVQDQPEISYVEYEFDRATEAGLVRLMFLIDENANDLRIPPAELFAPESGGWEKQASFRDRLLRNAELTVATFSSPAELGMMLSQALMEERLASRASGADSTTRLPAPRDLFGRDVEVDSLVAAWLATPPESVAVLGAPGIGKSAVCLAALHDPRVQERFGPRRWFVRCDGASSERALLSALAGELGVVASKPGDVLEHQVRVVLESAPSVLILDNFETPWHQDAVRVEKLLRALGSIPGVAVTISVRGATQPAGLRWRDCPEIRPLSPADSRRLFLDVAGCRRFASDPDLEGLLGELDGMPLAVELLGYAAQGEPDLAGVVQRWRDERIELLKRMDGDCPELSVAASVEASVNSPLMTESARRLFGLLGCLPNGAARDDLGALLPGEGQRATSALLKLRLIFHEDSRVRMLAPVREHAFAAHPPDPADLARAVEHYATVAAVIERRGSGVEGGRVMARLHAEIANITVMLQRAADGMQIGELVDGMCGLIRYWSLTGTVQQDLIQNGEAAVAARGSFQQEARILRATGDLARARSRYADARARYQRALLLFRQIGDAVGEANCLMGIGDILRGSDSKSALAMYSDALSLYQRAESVLGRASCLKSQGNVAEDRRDYDTAVDKYKEALALYQEEGSVLGAANCIKSLGDIEQVRRSYDAASVRYEEALRLYRQAGSVLGEANCTKGLGDTARALSDQKGARIRYVRALRLYQRIAEPGSIGWIHVLLAQLEAPGPARTRHWDAARKAWASIGRMDLIESAGPDFE